MRHPRLAVVVAFAIGATMASGIAVAVTAPPSTLKACASKSGVLALRATKGAFKGKCVHGFSPVAFNAVGPKGPTGRFSASDLKLTVKQAEAGPQTPGIVATVSCPKGKIAVSGGADWDNTPGTAQALNSRPTVTGTTPNGWTATFVNGTNQTATGLVWAMCTT
jgi:hypothetical protein